MSPLGSLNSIIIYAGDAIKCASFYRDHFGFPAIGEWSSDWAQLDAGSCRLAFHQSYGAKGPLTEPTGSPLNPHKVVFTVPDVAAARQRLVDAGIPMSELDEYEDAGVILCQGADPEGHVFQLCNK